MSLNNQFAGAPKLSALSLGLADLFNYNENYSDFQNIVLNIKTAIGFGLDQWGERFGVSRSYYDPIENQSISLSDENYRKLLIWSLLIFQTSVSCYDIDFLLNNFFENRGRTYVSEIFESVMQLRYYFEFSLTPFEKSIIIESKILPIPTGVTFYYAEVPNPSEIIGFEGQELGNFAYANFFPPTSERNK